VLAVFALFSKDVVVKKDVVAGEWKDLPSFS
jgi:hypothetical protein